MSHNLIQTDDFHTPSKEELTGVLRTALQQNFSEVVCDVGPCPDLTQYGLAAEGLGGVAEYAECGTVLGSMFTPGKQRDVFNIPDTGRAFGRSDGFIVGSGAGSVNEFGVNSEWTGNAVLTSGKIARNLSKVAYISDMAKLPETVQVRNAGSRGEFGCIGNLMFTNGDAADVIRVAVRKRRDENNWSEDPHDQELIRIMRVAIAKAYPSPSQQVCLGGVMVVKRGETVTHVMPPYFPPTGSKPGKSFPDMKGWGERFFTTSNQLIGCTTFMNHQGHGLPHNLQWRLDHTHFYTQDGKEAGHYHYDISPEIIEYVAYLVPAVRGHKIELSDQARL